MVSVCVYIRGFIGVCSCALTVEFLYFAVSVKATFFNFALMQIWTSSFVVSSSETRWALFRSLICRLLRSVISTSYQPKFIFICLSAYCFLIFAMTSVYYTHTLIYPRALFQGLTTY